MTTPRVIETHRGGAHNPRVEGFTITGHPLYARARNVNAVVRCLRGDTGIGFSPNGSADQLASLAPGESLVTYMVESSRPVRVTRNT